jgi:hypothetical protein
MFRSSLVDDMVPLRESGRWHKRRQTIGAHSINPAPLKSNAYM